MKLHPSWEQRDVPGRSISRTCESAGCDRTTRESKPYCPDHVTFNVHAAAVSERLRLIEREQQRMRRHGSKAVDLEGTIAREILRMLDVHGPRTSARLNREMNLDEDSIQAKNLLSAYLKALKNVEFVEFTKTDRGGTMVHLTEKGEEHLTGEGNTNQ